MRIVTGAAKARETLLRRLSLQQPELPPAVRETVRRVFGADLGAAEVVDRILGDVREHGNEAVRRYNREIDGVRAGVDDGPRAVSREEISDAYRWVDASLVEALRLAARRIRAFHELQLAHSLRSFEERGVGQVVRPIYSAGIYVPGSDVVYPSTLLMTAIPARVAGVREVVMVTPVSSGGSVNRLKLVAADIAGVDQVFPAGGVQGIAAMAYGTETIPRVDKICGPGNIFVTIAKKKLYGEVGVDGIFGPSETLVVADDGADASLVAADMLAGAEHDELATAVLITTSAKLAEAVSEIVDARIGKLERFGVAQTSMQSRGGAVVVDSEDKVLGLANEFAPEHLCLHWSDPDRVLERITNAGCVFVGGRSAESIGDYTAGPSHVMPTGGSAAYASPLGVHDFLKVTSIVRLDQATVDEIAPAAAAIARAEGLTGHARAVEARMKKGAR